MRMRYDWNVCNSCGKSKPIVNKKYNLCLKCNRDRLNLQEIHSNKHNSTPKSGLVINGITYPKRSKIKKTSLKMDEGLRKYKAVKAKKRKDMIEGKYFRCFFTNKELDVNGNEEWHHALGRIGKLLYEYRNIFPVIGKYHKQYHDLDPEKLLKTFWYKDFLRRLKKHNHKVYNKELNRLLKAGIIDMDSFLNEYK